MVGMVCLSALSPASACPEVVVPIHFKDSAFQSNAWKTALRHYKKRRHTKALKALRKTDKALQKDVARLFQPRVDKEPSNTVIQRWLKRHVYTRHPGVLIHQDRFTYPALVWQAWADTACRAGDFKSAHVALARLVELNGKDNALHHRALVAIRLNRTAKAKTLLERALPDAFIGPYLRGLIQRAEGNVEAARTELKSALSAAFMPDQKDAVEKELARLK